jgi:hypothetical protein
MPFAKGHHVGRPRLPVPTVVIDDQTATVEIQLSGDRVAIVDWDDYHLVKGHRWYAKSSRGTFYVYMTKYDSSTQRSRSVWMHKLLLPNAPRVDHKNGNGLDNRRSNLRPCTHAQNMANRRKQVKTRSKFKGVTRASGTSSSPDWNKWRARININKKSVFLGYYDTELEAALAYNKAAVEHFGEFANLNKLEQ